MKKQPHVILEVANVHGGDTEKLKELINLYGDLDYSDLGIKFQSFKYDRIALEDYSWYPTYTKLFTEPEKWQEIISLANEKIGKVWLDVGDTYAIEIMQANFEKIHGIKFQASALEHHELFEALKVIDLIDKELIVNVSGYEPDQIDKILATIKSLNFKKIVLQIGFQNYPANIEDTPLGKIKQVQHRWPEYEISFADHLEAEDNLAEEIPIYAALLGCQYIEKHVCVNRKTTEFDHYSSLEFDELKKTLTKIQRLETCFFDEFICSNEKMYLDKIFQAPIVARNINKGELIAKSDLIYRRTEQKGLTLKEIQDKQSQFYVVNKDLKENSTLTNDDFKQAKIGVIVAGRLKSSRLKRKALLPIHGIASIERCLMNCLMFPHIDEVILATSTTEEDAPLEQCTLDGKVKFWKGDPDDVISRYLGACDKYGIDTVVRVTADCPVVSPEVAEILLKSHFEHGADYTGPNRERTAAGTICEIYNVEALRRVISYLGKADYSEYMNAYLQNNPEIFKINMVDLPEDLLRDYRLTLDYQEDLDLMNRVFEELEKNDFDTSLYNVFKVIDQNPEIARINEHHQLTYKVDKNLIEQINMATKIVTRNDTSHKT